MTLKPLEVRIPITELPTLVERKPKQTALRKPKQTALKDKPESMSLPINDLY